VYRIYGIEGAPSLALMRERTHPEDRALFDGMARDPARFDGKTVEFRLVLPDGSVKHIAVIASRVPEQAVTEYAGTVSDVTEARRAEEALQRTQSALADMTRVASLGEMAAAIAHEVNQPLSAIGLNASTCLRWLEETQLDLGEAREAALRIRRDASRAGAVVQRLRALFSKTEGVQGPMDLNDAIVEVVALARSRIRGSGATLKVELAEDLPQALGDRVQLQQVIMNLVSNALEAMKGEPAPRQLSIRTAPAASGRLLCEIRDSGRGVPEADRERIFEPFYTTRRDGMGIGLSICSNILNSHGGRLSVRDNGDAPGATFAFELPSAALG
jgi:C4-dicarboxylate-specific signal transduction histidine kinase